MSAVQHGMRGWDLVAAEWDPETGLARLEYERQGPGDVTETAHRVVEQPHGPGHYGWDPRAVQIGHARALRGPDVFDVLAES